MMKKLANIALWLWQLPQNLLGMILVAVARPEESYDLDGVRLYYSTMMKGGISLGKYIVVNTHYRDYNGKSEAHEYGHARQSMMLGPLYLFIVGIPSIIWAAWWNRTRGVYYYSFYTERWADRLGKVNRQNTNGRDC